MGFFLDSGAFTAWSKGVTIDIYKYIDFIKEHQDLIEVYANLDVIGDPEATWRNQRIMEEHGLKPLPVFHVEDGIEYLFKCMKYPYFCLGGMAKTLDKVRVSFLDKCWSIICDTPDRTPRCKVHGFGVTSVKLLWRYPWYSVDSTAWLMASGYGTVFVPKKKGGRFIYNEEPLRVNISYRNPAAKRKGNHFLTLSETERKQILEYFEMKGFKLGKSEFKEVDASYKPCSKEEKVIQTLPNGNKLVEVILEPGLCNDYALRIELNVLFFSDLEKALPEWPYPFRRKETRIFGLGRKK